MFWRKYIRFIFIKIFCFALLKMNVEISIYWNLQYFYLVRNLLSYLLEYNEFSILNKFWSSVYVRKFKILTEIQ